MRTIILSLILIFTGITGCKTQKDPAVKAAEKEIQKAEQQALFDNAYQALNDRKFVLEADRITFKYGRFSYVNSNTNFISLHDGRATIQMAFNSPYAGPNGIGGITVEGSASNIKMETDKKGNITFTMTVTGTGVSAQVSFNMLKGNNECTATIIPNFNSNTTTFTGYLYPEDQSNVFKAKAL